MESTAIRTLTGEELVKPILMVLEPQIHGGRLILGKNFSSIRYRFGIEKTLKNASTDSRFNYWTQIESKFIKAEKQGVLSG